MEIKPITFKAANEFVRQHHRHHKPVVGCKFCLSVANNSGIQGVAIIGRPVARALDDGTTLEVTRLCTNGARNACSMLYSTAARIARELGYSKIITYILATESGVSLRASGWSVSGKTIGREWDTPSRKRIHQRGAQTIDKVRYEIQFKEKCDRRPPDGPGSDAVLDLRKQ